MLKKLFTIQVLFNLLLQFNAYATYVTTGSGAKYHLSDLVANSAGDITLSGTDYFINDNVFISPNDTLEIITDELVKFATGTVLDVNGVLLIDPPAQVIFTAQNTTTGFTGVRIDSSDASIIRNLTFEYGNTLRIYDCKPVIDSCIFQYNTIATTLGGAAITLFRGSPLIANSVFINNQHGAISSSVSNNNAPEIINNLFQSNNLVYQNTPQINLGPSGTDTTKIINNRILSAATTNSGGIALTSFAGLNAVIDHNTIKHNRYGLTIFGTNNIYAMVSDNTIDSNTTQGDPALGGSGIALYGSGTTAASLQHVIVTGNHISGNLWGITLLNGAQPNLGDITNSATDDDGGNEFYNNTNTTTPGIDLYNNTSFAIQAQNNYWSTSSVLTAEDHIFHQTDDPLLGLVNFQPILNTPLPLNLISFNAIKEKNTVHLFWQTENATNVARFIIEKSMNGKDFSELAAVIAKNEMERQLYEYQEVWDGEAASTVFYRLKIMDRNNSYSYSPGIVLNLRDDNAFQLEAAPTLVHPQSSVKLYVSSTDEGIATIKLINAEGKIMMTSQATITKGTHILSIKMPDALSTGYIYLHVRMKDYMKTVPLFIQ